MKEDSRIQEKAAPDILIFAGTTAVSYTHLVGYSQITGQ